MANRSKISSNDGTSMSYKFSNINLVPVTLSKYNSSISQNDFNEIIDHTISFQYTVDVNIKRLVQQGEVFALQLFSSGKVDGYRLWGIRSEHDTKVKLCEVYIYSYLKAYMYGYDNTLFSSSTKDNLVLEGHHTLCKMLEVNSFLYDENSISKMSVNHIINVTPEQHDINYANMINSFKFLRDNKEELEFNYFKISNYERYLTRLENAVNDWCRFKSLDSPSEHLVLDKNPIGNSCYSKNDNSTLKYIIGNTPILNINYSFAKAVFITEFFLEDIDDDNSYFYSIKIKDPDRLTKYDVQSVTSLYPKLNPIGFYNFGVKVIPDPIVSSNDDSDPTDDPSSPP